jgi:hypothetical protein
LLALWTGQRQGDLLRLPWSAYDGKMIRLRQSKGGRRVVIPVGAPLKAALDSATRRSTIMLVNSEGKPWISDGFRASWRKAQAKAGVRGVTFRDLRGTSVTRLALAGCTEAEIATITGHSLRSVRATLDTHYLARDPLLGESAIAKLEANKIGSTGVRLAVASPAEAQAQVANQIADKSPVWVLLALWSSQAFAAGYGVRSLVSSRRRRRARGLRYSSLTSD